MSRKAATRFTMRSMKAINTIVAGGGWRRPERYRIKFKAICCSGLTIIASSASLELSDKVGPWLHAVPLVLLLASVLLFLFERPSNFPGWPDGDDDPAAVVAD